MTKPNNLQLHNRINLLALYSLLRSSVHKTQLGNLSLDAHLDKLLRPDLIDFLELPQARTTHRRYKKSLHRRAVAK